MSRPTPPAKLRIGIIAAETSGDLLGSGLMAGLSARVPGVEFEGIGLSLIHI